MRLTLALAVALVLVSGCDAMDAARVSHLVQEAERRALRSLGKAHTDTLDSVDPWLRGTAYVNRTVPPTVDSTGSMTFRVAVYHIPPMVTITDPQGLVGDPGNIFGSRTVGKGLDGIT